MVGIQIRLLWSGSFQLNFLAMAGLISFYLYFQVWGRQEVASLFGARERIAATGSVITDGFAATLAAIVAVGPLIAYDFGVVSLVDLPPVISPLSKLVLSPLEMQRRTVGLVCKSVSSFERQHRETIVKIQQGCLRALSAPWV